MEKDTLYKESVVHQSGSLPMKIYRSCYVSYHWHDEYEFLVATNNEAECTVDGQQFTLNTGEALLIQGGILHSLHLDAGKHVTAVVVHPRLWAGPECSELFDQLSFPAIFSPKTPQGAQVISLLTDIIAYYNHKPFGYEFSIKMRFCALFATLFERGIYKKKDSPDAHKSPAIRQIFEHVHTHFSESITLDSLCSITHYSKAYIIRLFKKHTGQTPTEYINRYRIERAKELLAATDKTVLDISLECGFSGVSYFIKTFKQYSGATPHQWRNL